MSHSEIERFIADMKSDASLLQQAQSGSTGLESVVTLATSKGYDITIDDAKAYIRDKAGSELSDDDLDAVAGGKGHHHHSTGDKGPVQSNTNVAASAEAVTVAVEAAAAATTVMVVAEGVAVLT